MANGRNEGGNHNRKFDADRKAAWLEKIAECGRRADANRAIGVSQRTVENHVSPGGKYYDPEFAEAYDEAMGEYRALLVQEAHRRGVDGVKEPVYYKGAKIDTVRKYSDRMLELLLKRHIPEFRDRTTVDQNVQHSGQVTQLHELASLPQDDRDALREMLERRRAATDDPALN